MTRLNDPLVVLRNVLAIVVDDYATSRDVAFAFWQRGNLAYDDVDGVWREFWGRGLFGED